MTALFGKERKQVTGGKIENVLGMNTTLTGQLRSDGNVRIDGVFVGTIETAGNVILGEHARVEADITANAVQVWGAVKGNITASSRLEILSSGRVWGDIMVASLLIDEGGVFRGESLMGSSEERFLIEGPPSPNVEIIELEKEDEPEKKPGSRGTSKKAQVATEAEEAEAESDGD